MAALGIRVVNENNASEHGHMYIVLMDGLGNKQAYGFYPANPQSAGYSPGYVLNVDMSSHETKVGSPGQNGVPNRSWDFPISETEYHRLNALLATAMTEGEDTSKPWGYYNAFTNSCVDFAWNVMREAGLSNAFFDGMLYPHWNNPFVDNVYYDFFRRPEFNREFRIPPIGFMEDKRNSVS